MTEFRRLGCHGPYRQCAVVCVVIAVWFVLLIISLGCSHAENLVNTDGSLARFEVYGRIRYEVDRAAGRTVSTAELSLETARRFFESRSDDLEQNQLAKILERVSEGEAAHLLQGYIRGYELGRKSEADKNYELLYGELISEANLCIKHLEATTANSRPDAMKLIEREARSGDFKRQALLLPLIEVANSKLPEEKTRLRDIVSRLRDNSSGFEREFWAGVISRLQQGSRSPEK